MEHMLLLAPVAGDLSQRATKHRSFASSLGWKQILETPVCCKTVIINPVCDASELVQAAMPELFGSIPATEAIKAGNSFEAMKEMDSTLSWIIRKYSDKILLKDSDREPKFARKKVRKSSAGMIYKERQLESIDDWQGPPPWDLSLGGDGRPKFLCDVMVSSSFALSMMVMHKLPTLHFGWVNFVLDRKLPVKADRRTFRLKAWQSIYVALG